MLLNFTFTISIKLRDVKRYAGTPVSRLSLVAHTWLALSWLDKLMLHATEVSLLWVNFRFQLLRALLRSASSHFSNEREYSAAFFVGIALYGYHYYATFAVSWVTADWGTSSGGRPGTQSAPFRVRRTSFGPSVQAQWCRPNTGCHIGAGSQVCYNCVML